MIEIDTTASKPLYWQIYQQIKDAILSGELAAYSKLTSTRRLAELLHVSRNTVEQAYLQLWSEGYIVNNNRSKFIVEDLPSNYAPKVKTTARKFTNKPTSDFDLKTNADVPFNFRYGHLTNSDFPLYWWRKLASQCLTLETMGGLTKYNDFQGELDLRIEIMNYIRKTRNVSCTPDQIVICPGIHNCLNLLAILFQSFTDQFAMEDPGFDGARNVFTNNGYQIIPISLKQNVIDLEKLNTSSAKIIFVTPSHQFPMGSIMPIQKRLELLNWADKNAGIILEDDYDSELRYNIRPIPAIQSFDKKGLVFYIGTFSKVLAPGLRLSYFVIPQPWLLKFQKIYTNYYAQVSWLEQKILQQFMKLGHWESHLRRISLIDKRKHDLLVNTIQKLMSPHVIIHGKNAGLHIILELTNSFTEQYLIKKARDNDVIVYPVSRYWIQKELYTNNMVMLGVSNMNETEIIAGINQLYQAWFS